MAYVVYRGNQAISPDFDTRERALRFAIASGSTKPTIYVGKFPSVALAFEPELKPDVEIREVEGGDADD